MFDARNRLLDDMSEKPQNQPDLIERIERALLLLAYFIELDGDVHLPMYAKFEAELEDLKRAQDTRERARARLAGYAVQLLPSRAR
jgi:hypothetical protein